MKRFFVIMMALVAVALASGPGSASAFGPTVVPLLTPHAPAGLANVHWGYCSASGFNADGTISGVCQYSYGSSGGSGRGGGYRQPPTASYSMTWGPYGQTVGLGFGLGALCSCARSYSGTPVTINGVPYYLVATASNGNQLVSSNTSSFLVLQALPAIPAAPVVTAVLAGYNVQVSWTPDANTQSAITSSNIAVTPTTGSAPTLTATVSGTTATATLGPLQSNTDYSVAVANVDVSGPGAWGSTIISTPASTVPPSAPTISYLYWTGSQLAVAWTAPASGDSPIDAYQVKVVFVDGDATATGPFTQTVSAQTLRAYFVLDNTSSWSVQIQAHNTAGWGAWSAPKVLSGL